MDFFDEILNLKDEDNETIEIDAKEYFDKTKSLLMSIDAIYGKAYKNRGLKDSEYPEESICDSCKGCGIFKKDDGEEYECNIDYEEGECYVRELDLEEFAIEMECEMENVWSLLFVDKIKEVKDYTDDIVLIASIDAKTKEGKFCNNIAKMALKK